MRDAGCGILVEDSLGVAGASGGPSCSPPQFPFDKSNFRWVLKTKLDRLRPALDQAFLFFSLPDVDGARDQLMALVRARRLLWLKAREEASRSDPRRQGPSLAIFKIVSKKNRTGRLVRDACEIFAEQRRVR